MFVLQNIQKQMYSKRQLLLKTSCHFHLTWFMDDPNLMKLFLVSNYKADNGPLSCQSSNIYHHKSAALCRRELKVSWTKLTI